MDFQDLSDEDFRVMISKVEDEKRRRAEEEARLSAANQASIMFHQELARSVDHVRGLPTWQKPSMAVTGYYSGAVCWHEGYGWQNVAPHVALAEPGEPGSGWVTFEDSGIEYPEPEEGAAELPPEEAVEPPTEPSEPEEEVVVVPEEEVTDGPEYPL